MNYQEALAYLYSLSDFERSGVYTRNPEENLPREARLLELLGNPQRGYTCTLIAGTKGKGSTAVLIERVLREAGVRTGLYTQPDLHTFRERIRVNGRLISESELGELLLEVRAAVEFMHERHEFQPCITYEVATALALLYFCRQGVEHAVLEVGLGGRLDATNVVEPLVSVITSISYDHMQILGSTLREIATEKAGIVKPNGVVVTSAQAPEAVLAIAAVCKRQGARLVRVGAAGFDAAQVEVERGELAPLSYRYYLEGSSEDGQRFTIETPMRSYRGLEMALLGRHQLENATVAVATLDMLAERGVVWDEGALREGLHAVHWPGRIEVVGHDPLIVVDGAHNADSMLKLLRALRELFPIHRLIVVLSVASDKDVVGMVQALADVDVVILTRMANARAAPIEELEAVFAEYAPHVTIETAHTSDAAMALALDVAVGGDLICATGSLYLVGEVLRWSAARGDEGAAMAIEGVDHV